MQMSVINTWAICSSTHYLSPPTHIPICTDFPRMHCNTKPWHAQASGLNPLT